MLNSYFKGTEDWRVDDILKRAEHLVDHALNLWPYFGDLEYKNAVNDSVIGSKPETLTVLDQIFTVKSWREVLQFTLEAVAREAPGPFAELTEKLPHYISRSPQSLRTPKELVDGYYFEANLGAKSIKRLCLRVISSTGYPNTAWDVQTTSK